MTPEDTAPCGSGARRAPKQACSPKAEGCGGKGHENPPWLGGQMRSFFDDTPDMCQSKQTKDCAGGHDVGLHETDYSDSRRVV